MRLSPISLLITSSWLIMAGLLVHHHVLPQGPPRDAVDVTPQQVAAQWRSIHDFMLLRRGEEILGASALVAERDRETGLHTAWQRLEMDVGALGFSQTLSLAMVGLLDENLALRRFWMSVQAGLPLAMVEGEVRGDSLLCRVTTLGSAPRLYRAPLSGPISLAEVTRQNLLESVELEPGTAHRVPAFSLIGGVELGDLVIEIGNLTLIETMYGAVAGYEVTLHQGGRRTKAWVDEMGEVVQVEILGDMVLERVPRDLFADRAAHLVEPVELPAFDLGDGADAQPWPSSISAGLADLLRRSPNE